MNPRLTRDQQKKICFSLGRVRLQLLYKASIHGFTAEVFHQRCDTRCPTVSVGYNASGYIFGGYTKQPFSQSGQFMSDDQAFLFKVGVKRLIKYPVVRPYCAVKMQSNSGPSFGDALFFINDSQPVVYSSPGNEYKFNAVEMHGDDLKLTEFEVYQVEETTEMERPWRTVTWKSETKAELMEKIRTYEPLNPSVASVRVLLIGPVGAGKSSFFNSVSSVFKGRVTNQAMAGCLTTSLTTQFRTYSLKDGRQGKPLPITLCDTMGLEENTKAGLNIDDIISIVNGHLPDRYEFNPAVPLSFDTVGFRASPALVDKIHCVAFVIDACKVSIMPSELEEKINTTRRKINSLGVPQLALLTKVDEACPLVEEDVTNVYTSFYIKQMMQEASTRLGLPLSCVIPVKNYSQELEVDLNCDILLLSAIYQMLCATDDYFEEISDQLSNMKTKELEI